MEELLSILIVDDEPEARDLLTMLLERIDGVELTGEAESVDQALRFVQEHTPDLILLDIQMPVKTGFDLVSQLHEMGLDQGYIFVTAYDEYAIEAIRASAFDYLLKPVDPGILEDAIRRFRENWEQKQLRDKIGQLLGSLGIGRKLKFNTRSGFLILDPDEILCCIADGNYTKIMLVNERQEVISSNLGSVENMLEGEDFFRISRSALINFKFLAVVDTRKGVCRLEGNTAIELKVARNRLSSLETLL
ncbi:MAG: LytR/AlgR family response regulator transcription factor [Bacteroidales bacterium]